MISQLQLQALRLLHHRKISHGDSRIHNLINVRGEYKWIDVKGQLFIPQTNCVERLGESLLNCSYRKQTVSNDLASLYSSSVPDVEVIAAAVRLIATHEGPQPS